MEIKSMFSRKRPGRPGRYRFTSLRTFFWWISPAVTRVDRCPLFRTRVGLPVAVMRHLRVLLIGLMDTLLETRLADRFRDICEECGLCDLSPETTALDRKTLSEDRERWYEYRRGAKRASRRGHI